MSNRITASVLSILRNSLYFAGDFFWLLSNRKSSLLVVDILTTKATTRESPTTVFSLFYWLILLVVRQPELVVPLSVVTHTPPIGEWYRKRVVRCEVSCLINVLPGV